MSYLRKALFNLFLYAIFFTVCSIVAFYTEKGTFASNSASWQLHITSLDSFLKISATQFINLFGNSDLGSYVKSAKYLLQNGYFQKEMIGMWPPGFAVVIASILKFTGENSYPFKMIIITIAAWALAFFFVYHSLITIKNSMLKIFAAMLPLYFETFRIWIFGLGPFLSETISLPLFVIAISFFIRWLQTERPRDLVWMAVFLAISAYFRGYIELFGNFLILILALVSIFKILKYFVINKLSSMQMSINAIGKQFYQDRSQVFSQNSKLMLLAAITFILILLPWRIYMHKVFGSFNWQQLGSLIWTILWYQGKLQYFPDSNLACQVQPALCKILAQNVLLGLYIDPKTYELLTLVTLVSHPLRWYAERAEFFNAIWFGTFGVISWHDLLFSYRWLFFEGSLIFFTGIIITLISGWLWFRHSIAKMNFLFWFSILFILFNIILFSFFHYEARYSLFIRLYFLYSVLGIWVIFLQHKMRINNNASAIGQ